jgi:hypothetical protein
VQTLFFVHPNSFKIIKENLNIILINATYKYNKFNIPLLHIISTTYYYTIYNVAFSFIAREDARYYK